MTRMEKPKNYSSSCKIGGNKMKRLLSLIVIALLIFGTAACSKINEAGDKIDSVKEAQATVTLASGEKRTGDYTGEATDGVPNGEGVFSSENTEGVAWTYTGGFVNGKFEGQGKTVWEGGSDSEEGLYKDGLLNGEGKIYVDGALTEEGEFKDGLLSGSGKMYETTGEVMFEGEFNAGMPVVDSVGLNAPVQYADWGYFCTKAESHTSVGDYATNEKYVVYLITAKNNSKGPRELGDFFILTDDQGRVFNMNTDVALEYHYVFDTQNWHYDETGASLSSKDIPIAFEVPKDATGFQLIPAGAEYKGVSAVKVEISE